MHPAGIDSVYLSSLTNEWSGRRVASWAGGLGRLQATVGAVAHDILNMYRKLNTQCLRVRNFIMLTISHDIENYSVYIVE